jgi:hypothetical protein
MSSFGKDVVQQLSQMSGAAEQFIILGSAGTAIGAAGGAVAADLAAGAEDSLLFGTRYQGNAALWNSGDFFRIGYSQVGEDEFVFRIGGDWINGGHINLWPPSWWFGQPAP